MIRKTFLVRFFCKKEKKKGTDLQRRGLSFRPFWLQVSAVTVQRHWHVVESKAHFLLRHGRQRVVGEGEGEGEGDGKEMVEGEILVGGSDGGEGKDVAEGTGGAWVLHGRGI